MNLIHKVSVIVLLSLTIRSLQASGLAKSCAQESTLGVCLRCHEGYDLENGVCNLIQKQVRVSRKLISRKKTVRFGSVPVARRLQATFCVFPDDGSDCLMCQSLYYLNPVPSPTCLAISDPNCASSGGFNNVCEGCNANYYLNSKSSRCTLQSLPGCLAYVTGENYCTSCTGGMILTAGRCLADNSPNCAVYTARTNRCSRCNSGYYFFNGGCRSNTDPNCSYAQIFGPLCSSCNTDYFPNSNSRLCELRNDPNCSAYSGVTADCATCNNLYYLRFTRCVPITAFYTCITSEVNVNNCEDCMAGYVTDGNGGCIMGGGR
jgi:hypothetical protein